MDSYRNKETDLIEERVHVIRLKLMHGSARGNLYYTKISSCVGAEMLDFEPELLLDNYFISDCEFRLIRVNDDVPEACKWILRKSKAMHYNYVEPLHVLGNFVVGIEILHCEAISEKEQLEEDYLRKLLEQVMNEDLNISKCEVVLDRCCNTCATCTGIKTEAPRCKRTNRPAVNGRNCKHYKPDGEYKEVMDVPLDVWMKEKNPEIEWKDSIVLFATNIERIAWQGTVEQFHLRKDGFSKFSDWKVRGYALRDEQVHLLEIVPG